jgi:molybdate transport system substrate-binding protein
MRCLSQWVVVSAAMAAAVSPAAAQVRSRPAREVVVSAAVSLTEVLQQAAPIYQAKTGERVVLNLGASNTLARQIAFGAGVDVFISADEAQMNVVAAQVDSSSRVNLLSNRLAIAVPDDRPRPMASARDLLDPAIRRIAIGDPAAVPAGVYAKQYLQTLGIWADLAMKVIPSGSVRLALVAVESGAADAAIVYHTDIATSAHVREALVIPVAEGPRIVYPAALVRGGKNPEGGRQLLAFLRSPEAIAIFTRSGFLAPIAARN